MKTVSLVIASILLGLLAAAGASAQNVSATPTPASEQQTVASPAPGDAAETSDRSPAYRYGFFRRFWEANADEFRKKDDQAEEETPPARRALPAPFQSPPFPSGEYQGYPLIGVPAGDTVYPLMKAINGGPCGDTFKDLKINIDGWVNASANWSNARNSNSPTAYWIVPNALELDQTRVACAAHGGHGADRPRRLGFPLRSALRPRLSLHGGRRLAARQR